MTPVDLLNSKTLQSGNEAVRLMLEDVDRKNFGVRGKSDVPVAMPTAQLLVELAALQAGESVGDLYSMWGNLLVEASLAVNGQGRFFGECNELASTIMSMTNAKIEKIDANTPSFDVALSVLPCGKEAAQALQRVVDAAKNRAVVLAPFSLLYQNTSAKVRKNLLPFLATAIELPSNILYNSSRPFAVLIFEKKRKDNHVLFLYAKDFCKETKRFNFITYEDRTNIIKKAGDREYNNCPYSYSKIVNVKNVKDSWKPSLYASGHFYEPPQKEREFENFTELKKDLELAIKDTDRNMNELSKLNKL